MKRNGFFRAKIRQPAEAVTERSAIPFRFLHVLVKSLQSGDGESNGRKLARFTQHPRFIVAVAMQRDQERTRAVSLNGHVEIIVKLNFCGEGALLRAC